MPMQTMDDSMENNYGYSPEDVEIMRMAKEATVLRGEKIEEIRLWARNAGIRKIGIANCAALAREAEVVAERLSDEFEVRAVGCKVGKIPLADLIHEEDATGLACNPIGQVRELEEWGCEFIIVMGLCLGHDMLLAKYCHVPMTTLIVKDRAHKHNPMESIHPMPEQQ